MKKTWIIRSGNIASDIEEKKCDSEHTCCILVWGRLSCGRSVDLSKKCKGEWLVVPECVLVALAAVAVVGIG